MGWPGAAGAESSTQRVFQIFAQLLQLSVRAQKYSGIIQHSTTGFRPLCGERW